MCPTTNFQLVEAGELQNYHDISVAGMQLPARRRASALPLRPPQILAKNDKRAPAPSFWQPRSCSMTFSSGCKVPSHVGMLVYTSKEVEGAAVLQGRAFSKAACAGHNNSEGAWFPRNRPAPEPSHGAQH